MRLQISHAKLIKKNNRLHGGKIKNVKKMQSNIAELTKQFNNITGKKAKKFTLKL